MSLVNKLGGIGRRLTQVGVDFLPAWLRRFLRRIQLGKACQVPALPATDPQKQLLVIGPVNYAGQGYVWGNAVAAASDLAVHSYAVEVPGGFSFAVDSEIPVAVYETSRAWQKQQLRFMSGADFVLLEAEVRLFGNLFQNFKQEVRALRAAGVNVAFLAHGTDIRVPSQHVKQTRWSIHAEPGADNFRAEWLSRRNIAAIRELGGPVFVSTPDLLVYTPEAIWCPVAIDLQRWRSDSPKPQRERPLVVHAPSRAAEKGTDIIEPLLFELERAGVIDYQRIQNVPSAKMPEVYQNADIVLDQFRAGSYGVTAVEAMAAGCVVVGHITPQVERAVEQATGVPLPIVSCEADQIGSVLRELISDQAGFSERIQAGQRFVKEVHSGEFSARALLQNWLRPQ